MLRHIHLDQCDSTQDELERHVEAGIPTGDNYLISTSKQTNGRGRGAHSWDHLQGAIAFSFNCTSHPHLTWQALELAVVLADFFEREWSAPVELKWPNDLYAQGKKCGGILLKNQTPHMMIGVGVNIFPDSSWGHVLPNARQLSMDWQQQIPESIVQQYLLKHPMDVSDIRAGWLKRCFHLNKQVTISDGAKVTEGWFVGLGEFGEALVQTAADVERVFNGSLRWQD